MTVAEPSADRPLTHPALIIVDHRRSEASLGDLLEAVSAAARREDRIVLWSIDADAATLAKRFPKVQFEHHPAAAWGRRLRDLSAVTAGPICVVEDRVVRPGRRWLAEMRDPLERGEADVTVAASNAAPHPYCPSDPPAAGATASQIRRFAETVRTERASRQVDSLHGPVACFAPGVLHGTSEGATSLKQLDVGPARIRHLSGVYLHVQDGVPELSVAMIMKDEEADLAECIGSIRSLADEIVIYDTGSTDGSVELARSLGAIVIEGEWRDDFAWARNQALRACRGTWVLSIDADERLELDPDVAVELRGLLGDDPPVERFIIELFDLQGSIHAPVRSTAAVPMARLFRRTACHWVGPIHEQPDARPATPALRNVALPGIRFLHRGYLSEIVHGKNKWARNLAAATAGIDRLPDSDKECFDLGRSLRSVGELDRAFALFERAADLGTNPVVTRGALEFAILALTETGQADQAEPYLARLERLEDGAGPARYLRGWVHIALQQWAEAVAQFEGLTDYNDHFTGFRIESVPLGLALGYRGLGRRSDAVASAVQTLGLNAQAVEAWMVLFDCSVAGSQSDLDAARAVPHEHYVPLFANLTPFPASAKDRLAEALWHIRPGDPTVLAVASQLAPELASDRRITWSARLRSSGLGSLCPLSHVADDGSATVAERAAILTRAVHEIDADDLAADLERTVALLHDNELAEHLAVTLDQFPGAAGSVIVGGATTAGRCVIIISALQRAGYENEALAVLTHAADLDAAQTLRQLAELPELAGALRRAAESSGRDDLGQVLPDAA